MASKNLPKAVKAARAATSDAPHSLPGTRPDAPRVEPRGDTARDILETFGSINEMVHAVVSAIERIAHDAKVGKSDRSSHFGDFLDIEGLASTAAYLTEHAEGLYWRDLPRTE